MFRDFLSLWAEVSKTEMMVGEDFTIRVGTFTGSNSLAIRPADKKSSMKIPYLSPLITHSLSRALNAPTLVVTPSPTTKDE